jgi:hypothetical protein
LVVLELDVCMHEPLQKIFLLLHSKGDAHPASECLGLLQILYRFLSELDIGTPSTHSYVVRLNPWLCVYSSHALPPLVGLCPRYVVGCYSAAAPSPQTRSHGTCEDFVPAASAVLLQVRLAPLAEVEHVVADVAVLALEVAVPAGALVGLQVPVTKREGGRRQKVERECCVTTPQDSFACAFLVRTLPRWGSSSA